MIAMAPPFETRQVTAIWWRFFKKPPRLSAMAPPWPLFNNTGCTYSINIGQLLPLRSHYSPIAPLYPAHPSNPSENPNLTQTKK